MRILILIPALLASTAAFAVECKSVDGHVNNRPVAAKREAVMQGNALLLSGTIGNEVMPHQSLDCLPFAGGVMCEFRSAAVILTITTKGVEMVETIKDMKTGQEYAAITYQCARSFTLKR